MEFGRLHVIIATVCMPHQKNVTTNEHILIVVLIEDK